MPAVLVSMVRKEGDLCFLLEVRSKNIKQPGEICFPGGHREPDETPVQTALRETSEELGIQASSIRILGEMENEVMSTGRRVQAVLGLIDSRAMESIVLSECEVAEIFFVPVRWLREHPPVHYELAEYLDEELPEILLQYLYWYKGDFRRSGSTWYWEYEGHGIWGLTARILRQALTLETVQKLEKDDEEEDEAGK